MDTKYKVILGSAALVTAFAVGRYTTPVVVKTETKIVEVEKKTKDKDTQIKKKKKKTTVIITKPDGTKEEHTVTETDTDKASKEKETTDKNTSTDSKTETSKGTDAKTTVGLLIGIDFKTGQPVYGGSVYRPVLGPVGIGLNCLTNGTCSATVGVSF